VKLEQRADRSLRSVFPVSSIHGLSVCPGGLLRVGTLVLLVATGEFAAECQHRLSSHP